MNIFNLPDLGEGLPDAEICEWLVNEGDTVTTDQPIVSMETAKAIVEVPSPQDGVIAKLYGKAGDIIQTGKPLVGFGESADISGGTAQSDQGTVVGEIASSNETISDELIIGGAKRDRKSRVKTTPAVRNLARKLTVDLNQVTGTGEFGVITRSDVEQFAASSNPKELAAGFEPLHGVRRSMVRSMSLAHQQVVPVTIFDDADIAAWSEGSDITVRLIQAVVAACAKENALNASFDGENCARKLHEQINLGLAMDTPDGLFVPVIKDAANLHAKQLRETIDRLKQAVRKREIAPQELTGATITLSNFGNFAGRYASPIVVPPTVAIIGVGKLRETVVAENGKPAIHKMIPLSVTFDHRAVTGGEATRFLGEMLSNLGQK